MHDPWEDREDVGPPYKPPYIGYLGLSGTFWALGQEARRDGARRKLPEHHKY